MGPIQYLQAMPQEDFLRDIQGGLTLGSALQDQQLKRQQLQLALDLKKQYLTDAQSAMQSPTPQAFTALAMKYPDQAAHIKDSWGMLNTEQQQNELRDASTLAAALHANRPDVALDAVNQRIELMQKQGQPTQQLELLRDTIQNDPTKAYGSVMHVISGIPGGDKVLGNLATVGKEARDQELQPATLAGKQAEVRNVNSQITERAARLGLDRDKLTTETQIKLAEIQQKNGELKDDARKLVNDNTVAATTSEQHAGQMDDLAQRLDAAAKAGDLSDGNYARTKEWLKQQTGNQEYVTALRNEYTRLRTTSVLKNLPPGPATDRDIEMASKGFPSETADAAAMSSFLRGMAKLQRIDAATSTARAEWAGAVGHLGKPKTDIEIDGIKVPAGTSFTDFSRQFVQRMAEQRAAPAAPAVQQRSYMRHAGGQ